MDAILTKRLLGHSYNWRLPDISMYYITLCGKPMPALKANAISMKAESQFIHQMETDRVLKAEDRLFDAGRRQPSNALLCHTKEWRKGSI